MKRYDLVPVDLETYDIVPSAFIIIRINHIVSNLLGDGCSRCETEGGSHDWGRYGSTSPD